MSIYRLVHQQARENAVAAILAAPDGYIVELKEETRNNAQNRKLHVIIGDIAKQLPFMGAMHKMNDWKILLISGHSKATNEECAVLPGLEGEFVTFRESSAKMSKKRCASLIEYIAAYAAMNGVIFSNESRKHIEEYTGT